MRISAVIALRYGGVVFHTTWRRTSNDIAYSRYSSCMTPAEVCVKTSAGFRHDVWHAHCCATRRRGHRGFSRATDQPAVAHVRFPNGRLASGSRRSSACVCGRAGVGVVDGIGVERRARRYRRMCVHRCCCSESASGSGCDDLPAHHHKPPQRPLLLQVFQSSSSLCVLWRPLRYSS